MLNKRLINTGEEAAFDPLQNFETVTYTGNGGTQKITGYIRKGAAFNGSSSYVRLPNNLINNISPQAFSVSFWINPSVYASSRGVLGAYGYTSGVNHGWVIYLNSNLIRFLSYSSNGNMDFSSSAAIPLNTWTHVVVTYDSSNCTIYLNGSSDNSVSTPGNRTYTSSHPYTLGANDDAGTIVGHITAKLDQVRIFSKAISSSEVTTLYNEDYDSSTKSTTDIFDDGSGIALYELDEDANDTGASSTPIDSGQSGVFNGTSSYISLSNTAFHYTTLSISAWIKVDSFSSTNQIIQNYESGGSPQNSGFLFRTTTGGKVSFVGYSSSVGIVDSTTVLSTGIWYHVAAVITPSSWKIYVNGDDVSTNVTTNTIAYNSTTPCSIGRSDYTGGSGGYFDGQIDDLRIYNDALTATEVGYLADDDDANIPTGNLQAYYKLDGNANDTQGNYNGTANNVTYSDPAVVETGYNGTPSNVNFLGMAFQPDFVWIKQRAGSAANHLLFDSIRGAYKQIMSNTTSSGVDRTSVDKGLTSFDSNGFTVKDTSTGDYEINGPNGGTYSGNGSYVAWAWKAGGTAVSNTDGSITSTVSANPDAGFSIVKYTGNNTNSTVGHGLSSAPELVLYKVLSAAGNWTVYSSTLTDSHYLKLNTTDGQISEIYNIFNGQPDASVLKLGSGGSINGNSYEYIAYCFHSVDGYQKVGSFDGTGTTTGNIVTTGFRPRFLMWKSTIGTGNWQIVDSIRSPLADKRNYLYSDLSQGEDVTSYDIVDFNDDSFQMKQQYSNKSNETYIYLAIA